MAATLDKGRVKTVETRTMEEVPIGESGGLGCLPLEYLASCSEDELGIANVRIYRYDAGSPGVFLLKLDPALRIDEDWIGTKFGGGTYGVKVYSKGGRSGFDPRVRIDPRMYGPAKDGPLSTSANGANQSTVAPAPTPPANDAVLNRLADILERQNDRIERLVEQRNAPPAPSQNDVAQNSVVSVMAEASKAAIGVVAEAAKAAISAPAVPAATANSFDQDLQRLKILKEIAAPPASATPQNPLEQVTQFVTLFDTLDKFRGGGGGRGDWKDTLVEKGIERIPDLVDLGKSILAGRSKEAEELRKREEARARFSDNVRALQGQQPRPGAPGATPSPAVAQAPPPPGDTVAPLRVVPINAEGPSPSVESPLEPEIIPPEEPAQEQVAMVQEWFKRRIVQLVAEGDEPGAVLDFIDRVDPVVGAIITKSTEKQIRAFLAADPILAEITRLPNYEAFLRGLLVELRDDDEPQADTTQGPPPLKVN